MKQRKTFKEKWIKTDELCPSCGNITKENKGLTKQNIKKLFRKPTAIDLALLIIIILTLLGSFVYLAEVQSLRTIVENPGELCELYYTNVFYTNTNINDWPDNPSLNATIPW